MNAAPGPTAQPQDDTLTEIHLPPIDLAVPAHLETATFALGWFWGPDAQFGALEGVVRTRAGYAGGTKASPTYRDLGDHTESLQVDYDPIRISFGELLHVFWGAHDPTHQSMWNQYKTILFYEGPEQERLALESRDRLQETLGRPVRTEIRPLAEFTQAEDYHQKYRLRHERALMDDFRAKYPAESDFVRSTAATRVNGYLDGYGDVRQLEREIDDLGLSGPAAAALHEHVSQRGRGFR